MSRRSLTLLIATFGVIAALAVAVLAAWLNPHQAVVPESELFPPGQTQQQAQQADTQQMTGSQQDAVAAALTQLHISYQLQEVVVQPEAGFPAAGVLKAG